MPVSEVAAERVEDVELDVLERAHRQLPEGSGVALALEVLIHSVRSGIDFIYGAGEEELTPSQVAKVLKMSRPHVYKLLDDSVIPSHTVGRRDRRVRLEDLLKFANAREVARCALAETFARAEDDRSALIELLADNAS